MARGKKDEPEAVAGPEVAAEPEVTAPTIQEYPKHIYHKSKPRDGVLVTDAAHEKRVRSRHGGEGWADGPRGENGEDTAPAAPAED